MMTRSGRGSRGSRVRTAGLVVLILVLAAGAGIVGYAVTHAAREKEPAATATRSSPSVYAAATAQPKPVRTGNDAPVPTKAGMTKALRAVLAAAGLGPRVRAHVVDVSSGAALLDRGGSVPAAPASTAKLLTAAALFSVHKPADRITTSVVAGQGGTVVLVGGGDPTLTGAAAPDDAAYSHAARIRDLATQLHNAHVRVTRIVVDDSRFAGPAVSPAWAAEDVPSDYASAITAVMADGGRSTPSAPIRSSSPDLAAGRELAAALGQPKLDVGRGRAPTNARTVATVRSAPMSVLVEQMLLRSDNVIAECLARQVALAESEPASFTGAARAVRSVLKRAGVDPGPGLVDGSGLAASDRVSAATLADVLRTAANSAGLRDLIGALPVAAWSGTLAGRYVGTATRAGAGLVRAKTGTLTGVSSLAGLVHDRDGRLLAFAFIADRTGATEPAEEALDVAAARLAGCGCR